MASIDIKLEGFDDLEKRLRQFGPRIELNGLRSANYAGATVVAAAVEQAAPLSLWKYDKHPGELKASIRAFRRTSKQYTVTHAVGIRGVYLKYGNTAENRRKRRVGKKYRADGPGFYGKFDEFGSSKQPARPFMRPAFARSVDGAIFAVGFGMSRAIQREAARR